MKKLISILLVISMTAMLAVGLTGCGSDRVKVTSYEDIDFSTFGLSLDELNDLMNTLKIPDQGIDNVDEVTEVVAEGATYLFENGVYSTSFVGSTLVYDNCAFLIYTDVTEEVNNSAAFAGLAIMGNENGISTWETDKVLCVDFGDFMDTWVEPFVSVEDYHVASVFVDPDTYFALLVAYDGEIVYDVTEHYYT